MSMRMRRKRNFDERMAACGNLLLAKGTAGILNMKEAAENYRALIDFSAASATRRNLKSDAERAALLSKRRKLAPIRIFSHWKR